MDETFFSRMAHYSRIWLAQMRYSLAREMQFKGNFILWIIVELCWFAMQLIFIEVLYFNVKVIAGWSQWEMILLVATSQLVQKLFQTFIMINCTNLPELIRTGKLDFYIAQPVSTRFLVCTRAFEAGSLVNCVLSLGIAAYAAVQIPIPFSLLNIVAYLVLVIIGVLVHCAFMIGLMTFAFWMTRAQGFVHAYYNLFQLARLPREVFRGVAGLIFTWGIPMLLVANVPAKTLIDGIGWKETGYLALITIVMFELSGRFFDYGLRRYTSASS